MANIVFLRDNQGKVSLRDKRVFLPRVVLAIVWIGLNANAIVPSMAGSIPQLVAKTQTRDRTDNGF